MSFERITPARMADVYFKRMHLRSLSAIELMLSGRNSLSERQYWSAVLQHLRVIVTSYNSGKEIQPLLEGETNERSL